MWKRKVKTNNSSIEFLPKTSLDEISNLSSFLQSVTPIIRSKSLSEDTTENFTLGDLWDCYEKGSAYGVGVPIILKNDVQVTQYYVPYLSAIQIYTIKSPTLSCCRNLSGDNNVAENNVKILSDENKLSRTCNNNSSNFNIMPVENSKGRLGYLYFEYSEVCAFTWRIPLVDKVSELSKKYPGLEKLNSVDLSPASWMAITWCPICYIPMIGMTKKVPTYFLTYHTISSLFQENTNDETGEDIPLIKKKNGGIPLTPFGLASYKMQNDVWMNNAQACTKYGDLQSAANCWLKQLNFAHHDFNIFTSNAKNIDHIYLF